MKNSAAAILFLSLSVLVILLFFSGGYGLYLKSGLNVSGAEMSRSVFWGTILSAVPLIFPLVLALALFFTFLRLRSKPGIRIVTYLFLLALSLGLLWVSQQFGAASAKPEDLQASGEYYFMPEKIYRLPEGAKLYINENEEGSLRNLVVPEKGKQGVFLELYPEGKQEDQNLNLRNSRGEARSFSLKQRQASSGPFPAIAGFSGAGQNSSRLFAHFTGLGQALLSLKSQNNPIPYWAAMGALVLYLVSVWGFIRVSRWPLFNAILVFFLLCGAGGLYGIFTNPIMRPVADIAAGFSRGLPLWVLVLALGGLMLALLDLLFIPYKRRVEEEADE